MKRKDQNIQNTKLYSPVTEGREGLIFICYLKFQDIVGRRKSDYVGMGERVVKTGIFLSVCLRICVPITSFTLPIPAIPTLAGGPLDRESTLRRRTLSFSQEYL